MVANIAIKLVKNFNVANFCSLKELMLFAFVWPKIFKMLF